MRPISLARDLLAYVGVGRRNAMLKQGDPAPAFHVRSHFGTGLRLADLAGKYVVLWFYPKADTPG
jgi:peroxiredoxin Q/BCP